MLTQLLSHSHCINGRLSCPARPQMLLGMWLWQRLAELDCGGLVSSVSTSPRAPCLCSNLLSPKDLPVLQSVLGGQVWGGLRPHLSDAGHWHPLRKAGWSEGQGLSLVEQIPLPEEAKDALGRTFPQWTSHSFLVHERILRPFRDGRPCSIPPLLHYLDTKTR